MPRNHNTEVSLSRWWTAGWHARPVAYVTSMVAKQLKPVSGSAQWRDPESNECSDWPMGWYIWARMCILLSHSTVKRCKCRISFQWETLQFYPSYTRNYCCDHCHSDLKWLGRHHHHSPKVKCRTLKPIWVGGGWYIMIVWLIYLLYVLRTFWKLRIARRSFAGRRLMAQSTCSGIRVCLLALFGIWLMTDNTSGRGAENPQIVCSQSKFPFEIKQRIMRKL